MERIDTDREKLLNAILFFARGVKHPTKTKIYKLLFFLDFTHFKQVGRPVTGLNYFTWKFGPVPRSLHREIEERHSIPGFEKYLRIITEVYDEEEGKKSFKFKALKKPDMEVFTPREQEILQQIAMVYRDVTASQISEISHLKNQPWDRTLKSKGENAKIDYLLALDDDALIDEETAIERMQERQEIQRLFPTC